MPRPALAPSPSAGRTTTESWTSGRPSRGPYVARTFTEPRARAANPEPRTPSTTPPVPPAPQSAVLITKPAPQRTTPRRAVRSGAHRPPTHPPPPNHAPVTLSRSPFVDPPPATPLASTSHGQKPTPTAAKPLPSTSHGRIRPSPSDLRPPKPHPQPHRRLPVGPGIDPTRPSPFGASDAWPSPGTSFGSAPGPALSARSVARPVGKKFLSESLTHPQPLRTLCQQALT